jgi:CheY-specific phosphatase CheX
MSSPNPLEKKLDRYYEDIIEKIMEIIEAQKNILGEQKEIRKDVAKLKEHLLETKANIGQIDKKISNLGKGVGGGASSSSDLKTTSPTPFPTQSMQATHAIPQPASQGGSPKSLKEFLAQEVAIFDVKVLNAFIKSTKEIIKTNTRIEPVFLKPIIDSKINLPIVIAGRMQLARDKGKGAMAYCMELDSASAITRAVFMLSDDSKITEADMKDVTSEICNQICGKSKLALKTDGYSFEIGLPEIHQGQPKDILAVLGVPKVALFFEYVKKPFYILFWG